MSRLPDGRGLFRKLERGFFNHFPTYLSFHLRYSDFYFRALDRHFAGRALGALALDVGCGRAAYPQELVSRGVAERFVCVDISPNLVRAARRDVAARGLGDRVRVINADAHHLPFHDESFDNAMSVGSINLWDQPASALADIHRVLRPGGTLHLIDQRRPHSPREVLDALFNQRFFGLGLPAWSSAELDAFMKGSPFSECAVREEDQAVFMELRKG